MTALKPGYEIFPHTADVGLSVHAKTLPELFEQAALGMTSLLTELEKIEPREEVSFKLKASSPETLLVDWLHEVLYQLTIKKRALGRFRVEMLKDFYLKAKASGELLQPDRHSVFREIKAVTRHALKIEFGERGYSVRIVFDI